MTDADRGDVEALHADRLYGAGGFVLADPFEIQLRRIGRDYLAAAWKRVAAALARHGIPESDLAWGWMHPGVTRVSGTSSVHASAYIGWLRDSWRDDREDARYAAADAELRAGAPAAAYACTYRAHTWRIAPDDADRALGLYEVYCGDELTTWAPESIVEAHTEIDLPRGPWYAMAEAIAAGDQRALDRAAADAEQQYTPLGYRILIDGYARFLEMWEREERYSVRLSSASDTP